MSGDTRTPSKQFHDAAAYLSHASSLSSVSNTVKLELYGLFKCVTVSTIPTTSKPSIFDMAGRAKWDAWSSAGKKHSDVSEAEKRYIDVARDLGWSEESTNISTAHPQHDEDVWDSDDDDGGSHRGGQSGMGAVVSVMAPPDVVDDKTVHGLVVANDLVALQRLLEEHPDTNVDSRDEFGYTPLHLAADRGNRETLWLLLKRGADSTIKDEDGLTPLELARIAGHDEIVNTLSAPPK